MPSPHSHTTPAALLADLRRARHSAPDELDDVLAGWNLRPLTGGRNNDVYTWQDADHGPVCIKIYRVDERQRVDREWNALTLLAAHGIDDAPTPLWLSPSRDQPAIGMTMVEGTPLLDADDLAGALKGLAHTTQRLRQLPISSFFSGLERIDSADHYVHRLTKIWPQQLAHNTADPVTTEMYTLLANWEQAGDCQTLRQPAPTVLSRGDSNLVNWLWNGSARCVDFEFSGHSDIAFDAADLIEHISARTIPDNTWQNLLPDLGITTATTPRFHAAQRTCALRWLAVLWKQRHQREDEFARQLKRVHLLQRR